MVSPLIGGGIAAATKFIPNFRSWFLENLDSGEVLQGQFHAMNVTQNVSSTWTKKTSLNRQNAILQFINGENDEFSFDGRFFRETHVGQSPSDKLQQLIAWARIDPGIRRPPVVQFWIGDGHVQITCVITKISNIVYARPDVLGGLRDVSFQVSLLKFTPFSLDDTGETDTRYARAKDTDYYELLTQQEYNNPMLGDAIRKAHPTQGLLKAGDVVRLPSIEGVRDEVITQKSIPLQTGFGRRDTPQRSNVQYFFQLRSKSKVSHVFQK